MQFQPIATYTKVIERVSRAKTFSFLLRVTCVIFARDNADV